MEKYWVVLTIVLGILFAVFWGLLIFGKRGTLSGSDDYHRKYERKRI